MLVDNIGGPSLLDFYFFNSQYGQIEFDFESIGFENKDITHLISNSFSENLYDLRAPIRYWTQRNIDGSADAVFEAIRKLIRAYNLDYTELYKNTGRADINLPELENRTSDYPARLKLPLKYRQAWGE